VKQRETTIDDNSSIRAEEYEDDEIGEEDEEQSESSEDGNTARQR